MENVQKKKREKFVQEWEDWQEKQKQLAYSDMAIAAKQLQMAQECLKALSENDDFIEKINRSSEIGLDKFLSTAQSLQKTASAIMREYFQVDEIIEELNSKKGDESDSN